MAQNIIAIDNTAWLIYCMGVGAMLYTTVTETLTRRKNKQPIPWEMAIIAVILCFGSWATVLLLALARRAVQKEMTDKLTESVDALLERIKADNDKAAAEAAKQSNTDATA